MKLALLANTFGIVACVLALASGSETALGLGWISLLLGWAALFCARRA